ncbi:MAG TPA: hypothetical protein PK014_09435 [Thermoanaerobaculia bacterium]|nr:hypothetical protein [Thermoanaerobaculia bacterium]HUM30408.1 hypothetical protein [Thermoanaerobaculia bacterium]HXK68581.1 hypothetical protein [Thermoanaerobaculia bacterium]
MDWVNAFREALLALDVPDSWQIQLGGSEAYHRKKGRWVEVDPSDVEGRMLENEEIKLVPHIGDLHLAVYFIPRMTLVVNEKTETHLARHITITMRPYYHSKTEEDAVGLFWKEYGGVVALLEDYDYELRNQDVDFIDDDPEVNYFVDTSFWKSLRDCSADEVIQEFVRLSTALAEELLVDDP